MAASASLSAAFFCTVSSSSSSPSLASLRPLFPSQLRRFNVSALTCQPLSRQSISPASFVRSMSGSPAPSIVEEQIKEKNSQNPVVVYSKSWCPYCGRVKGLFKELGVKPFVVELDQLADEAEVQWALHSLTGQATVPNVFIGGMHIGGCDDIVALHSQGKLIPLLEAARAYTS